MMKKIIFNLLIISVLILSSCSQNSKVYSTDYREGIVSIESKDILLNVFENKKFKQYKLIFNGKELIKQFVKENPDYNHTEWEDRLINGTVSRDKPLGKYIKFKTKKFGDIEIEQFDKIEIDDHTEIYSCSSKLKIKSKKLSKEIIIKNSGLIDFTIIKNNNKNYLFVLQGTQGSGSFSSIVDIYKLD